MNIEYSYNDKIPASTALSRINKASSISKPEYLIEDKYYKFVFLNIFFNVLIVHIWYFAYQYIALHNMLWLNVYKLLTVDIKTYIC